MSASRSVTNDVVIVINTAGVPLGCSVVGVVVAATKYNMSASLACTRGERELPITARPLPHFSTIIYLSLKRAHGEHRTLLQTKLL